MGVSNTTHIQNDMTLNAICVLVLNQVKTKGAPRTFVSNTKHIMSALGVRQSCRYVSTLILPTIVE